MAKSKKGSGLADLWWGSQASLCRAGKIVGRHRVARSKVCAQDRQKKSLVRPYDQASGVWKPRNKLTKRTVEQVDVLAVGGGRLCGFLW